MPKITKRIHFTEASNESSRQQLANDLEATSSTADAHRVLIEQILLGAPSGGNLLVHRQFDFEEAANQ
ncbi:hypothetical protein ACQGAO_32650 [Rhodococcus sp. 1.20]